MARKIKDKHYYVSDGIRQFKVRSQSSLHAGKSFLKRLSLNKSNEQPGPVLYVRRGKGGGLECEVWYFTSQFFQTDKKYKKVSVMLLEHQIQEPKFVHGAILNRKPVKQESKQKRRSRHLKSKGLCLICGKEKETKYLKCNECRKKDNKKTRKSYHKQKNKISKQQVRKQQISQLKKEYEPAKDQFQNPYNKPNGIEFDKEATEAQPGSEEKIGVLIRRYKKGVWLWHPEDNKAQNKNC